MTIREYLKSLGAAESELTAKVVTRMEQAMMFDSDLQQFKPDTVVSIITRAADGLKEANKAAEQNKFAVQQLTSELNRLTKVAETEKHDLKMQIEGVEGIKINDKATKDAVMAYAASLKATKEVFGEDAMTSDVIVAAINAGSYMAWRSIMGPKDEPKIAGRRL